MPIKDRKAVDEKLGRFEKVLPFESKLILFCLGSFTDWRSMQSSLTTARMTSAYLYGLACGLTPAVYSLARAMLDIRRIGSTRSKPWIAGATAVSFWFICFLSFSA